MTTKEQLLACAKDLLVEKGYENTKIEDITKRANLAKGTFYIYFKTKEDMVTEILLEYTKNFDSFINSIKLQGNLEKNIYNLIKSLFEATNYNSNAVKLLTIILSNENMIKKVRGLNTNVKMISLESLLTLIFEDAKNEIDEYFMKNINLLISPIDMFIKFFLVDSFDLQPCLIEGKDLKVLTKEEMNVRVELLTQYIYKSVKK